MRRAQHSHIGAETFPCFYSKLIVSKQVLRRVDIRPISVQLWIRLDSQSEINDRVLQRFTLESVIMARVLLSLCTPQLDTLYYALNTASLLRISIYLFIYFTVNNSTSFACHYNTNTICMRTLIRALMTCLKRVQHGGTVAHLSFTALKHSSGFSGLFIVCALVQQGLIKKKYVSCVSHMKQRPGQSRSSSLLSHFSVSVPRRFVPVRGRLVTARNTQTTPRLWCLRFRRQEAAL